MVLYILVSIIAYFIGSVSFAVIFSRKFAGFDVRDKGSKGAGATNVLRTAGAKIALLTLVCDILKGIIAIVVAIIIGKIWTEIDMDILKYLAGFFAILGHTFPIFFEFRGGKGVATSNSIRSTSNFKLENWFNMLNIWFNNYSNYKNGISWINFISYSLSNINNIYGRC